MVAGPEGRAGEDHLQLRAVFDGADSSLPQAQRSPHVDHAPEATLVITTHNRCEDLVRALVSAQMQTTPLEIIVLDDASEDGTRELVTTRFPDVRYWRSETSQGYIRLRNRGAEMASAPIIFSIDDDAEFSTPNVVAQTLSEFDDPAVGAVSIPYLDDVDGGQEVRVAPAPDARPWAVWHFIGTSHAVRRDLFLEIGGYETALEHFGEEYHFGLRLLDRGFVVRLGGADPIFHHLSPKSRSSDRVWLSAERSYVLTVGLLAPTAYVVPELVRLLAYSAVHVAQGAPFKLVARGVGRGYRAAWQRRWARTPVARSTYRLRNRIRFKGPVLVDIFRTELKSS